MKKYLVLIISALALVGLMAGAVVLYDSLSENNEVPGGGLQILPPGTTPPGTIPPETTPPETTSPETTPPETTPPETTPPETTPPATLKSPDFTVIDVNGREVKLSDFAGKPIIVNFWASWCPPCKAEMPDFEAAYKKYGDRVNFLMVNMTDGFRETVSDAKKHASSNGYTFPLYFDTKGNASDTYGVYSLPTTYFFNANGEAVAMAEGMISASALEQGIGMILEK